MESLIQLCLLLPITCLCLGDDVDLFGAKIKRKEINHDSLLTELTFPSVTEPVGYDFLGLGIVRNLKRPDLKYLKCTTGLKDGKTHVKVTWL